MKLAGYQVQFCAGQIFEDLVTATGLNFSPVTAAPFNMMQQNLSRLAGPLKLIGWLNQHFKPLARDVFSDLEKATRRTDAVLYSTLAFAACHVAEKQGVPALEIYITFPLLLPAPYIIHPFQPLPDSCLQKEPIIGGLLELRTNYLATL